MRIPENQIISSPFMGNYFCLLPGHSAAFVAVSKNGVTFLKKIAIYLQTGQIIENEDKVHHAIGYNDQSPYLVPVSEIKKYEKKNGQLLKFAVWRDPIERLVSIYKYFCLEREYQTYYNYQGLLNGDISFDYFMSFVEFELNKPDPLFQDEHIRRQSDYYKQDDVDFIIPIEKLNLFLKNNNILLLEEQTNTTKVKFVFDSEKWENKIKDLYKEDYNIKMNCIL